MFCMSNCRKLPLKFFLYRFFNTIELRFMPLVIQDSLLNFLIFTVCSLRGACLFTLSQILLCMQLKMVFTLSLSLQLLEMYNAQFTSLNSLQMRFIDLFTHFSRSYSLSFFCTYIYIF